jgi:tungstate transport system ATP-binding protein
LYQIRNLRQAYDGRTALQVKSLTIEPHAIVGLMGPNGSGNATLLTLLALVERPTSGEVRFRGRPAEPMSTPTRSRVTLLPQEPYLLKRSVFDNIAYGLRVRKDTSALTTAVHEALHRVGLPPEFSTRRWRQLSGGEAQRVAMAARLALRPEVLLLDEPTASVDADSAERIKMAALDARRRWGTTLVIASHDWQWVFETCDEILHLYRGRVFGTGIQNIIQGPWRPGTPYWQKTLADGQVLRVPPPPQEEAVAVIDPAAMGLRPTFRFSEQSPVVLAGTVTRMVWMRGRGDVAVTVRVGDTGLTVRLPGGHGTTPNLFPGRRVTVCYTPGDVRWI